MITRRKTRQIELGGIKIGGGAPLTVQSMTKTDTRDVQATLLEIWALEAAGCDIVRCAVPVREAAEKLGEIKRQIRIPLVADIHFNYKLALIALEQGVDGLRLNPGNIGGKQFVQQVVNVAKEKKIPIRIGVNAGSLEKDLLARYGGPTPEGMVESALRHIRILEDCNYPEMKVSLKASDPLMMIEAYRMLADQVDYPFHLGVTEAGTPRVGPIKSAVGLRALLSQGIGDTVRVSLSAVPSEGGRGGVDILQSLRLRSGAPPQGRIPRSGAPLTVAGPPPAGGPVRPRSVEPQPHAPRRPHPPARRRPLPVPAARPARPRQGQLDHPGGDERHRRAGDHDAGGSPPPDLETVGAPGGRPRKGQAAGSPRPRPGAPRDPPR